MRDDTSAAHDELEPDNELDRLRRLVGPSERSYASLQRDRDEAVAAAKNAEHELGRLRGDLTEMSVQLSRARQDQEVLLQRSEMTAAGRIVDRVRRRWTTSVVPRLARLARHTRG